MPSSKAPGRPGLQRQSVGPCTGAWQSSPQRSRPSAGRRQVRLCTRSRQLHGHRPTGPSGRGRHGPGMTCLPVGHGQARWPCHRKQQAGGVLTHTSSRAFPPLAAEAPPRCGVTRGGVAEADRYARPSHEAGTRRRQGRWEPTHGDPRDQPSCLTGSGSSERRDQGKTIMMRT